MNGKAKGRMKHISNIIHSFLVRNGSLNIILISFLINGLIFKRI